MHTWFSQHNQPPVYGDYPITILRKAGVDMTTPKPIQDTMDLFGQMLDELERLLKIQ